MGVQSLRFNTISAIQEILKNKIRIKNFHENHIKEEEKAFFIESILS